MKLKQLCASLCAAAMLLTAAIPAAAAGDVTITADQVKNEMQQAATYLVSTESSWNTNTGVSYTDGVLVWLIAQSGAQGTAYDQLLTDYFANAEQQLDNSGTLPYYGAESIGNLASLAAVLEAANRDISDFGTAHFNLPALMAAMDVSAAEADNPYLLAFALYFVHSHADYFTAESPTLEQALVDKLVSYFDGTAMDFWNYDGTPYYSVDDNSWAIWALQPYAAANQEVAALIATCLAYNEQAKSDAGYGSSPAYPDANTDSTALALTALSAVDDLEKAAPAYQSLLKFQTTTAGEYDGYNRVIATKDALFGLINFNQALIRNDGSYTIIGKADESSTTGSNSQTESDPIHSTADIPKTGEQPWISIAGITALGAVAALALTVKRKGSHS